jgi:general secretion pathway protein G
MNQKLRALRDGGFSLLEILIVVTILGILAAIAIPKLTNASQLAKESTLKDSLRLLRTQIGVYRSQHPLFPGYPGGDSTQTPTAQASYDQLLEFSDNAGNVSATSTGVYHWGPYVNALPSNPLNSRTDWKILSNSDVFVADDTTGWLYQPSTGRIAANTSGNDSAGHLIVEY